ncbi:FG-GAP-like repeat-containing protein [Tautonia plasticadhaerens]|uniref:ASPIC and UnbV n=1 Tax=Tautonia plasticadhaerens TaxID=2527974 RepID=A0A518H0C7_9BACT|nr:FG-GAP-like repeat-containing protein [Tautonia plasticadhaerens]QDV34261.1 ASPIC and UnbV [Tautonia plasticadhaerens]
MRRLLLVVAVLAGVSCCAGGWWGWRSWSARRYLEAIEGAKREASSGSVARARRTLEEAASRWPGRGEAEFLLGAVEQAMGRTEAAKAAWARVPGGSEFGPEAAMMLARVALAGDLMAEAERHLPRALEAEGPLGIEARESLLLLYKLQGRYEEARRLVRDGWVRYPDKVGTLQQLWHLDNANPIALEDHRRIVDRASRAAPEDDRVWLSRAHLANREARFDDSAAWLSKCLARRPEDPAVWRVALDRALAVQDPARAREALGHLPPGLVPPAEVLELRAWFASLAGDPEAERRALGRLVELDPGAIHAVDRLAGLASRLGEPGEVDRLRGRKGELDRLLERYLDRMFEPDPIEDAVELAGWAERLGRAFEARGWWELAGSLGEDEAEERRRAIARLDLLEGRRASAASLPELLADLEEMGTSIGPSDAPAIPGGPMPTFEDEAAEAGLTFTYASGKTPERQIPETMGGGVGLLDFDGDGLLDVFVVQGGTFPPDPDAPSTGDRLFRNRGDGTFEDATESSGIARLPAGYGHGVAVGDVDDDGDPDLFLTRWGSYALYRNNGDGTFGDATEASGLGGDRDWPTSAAFADLDGDGDLDLYVCHYLVWDPEHPRVCKEPDEEVVRLCNPGLFPSRPDHLYRNDDGRFVDVTAEAGIVDTHGRGMGVVANDFDGDGLIDLYVANDQTANFLWRNLGGMRFEESGQLAGVAASGHGGYQAGMGVSCGDPNGDGLPDLVVTNFYDEGTTFYQNLGRGIFNDSSARAGVSAATRSLLGFGIAFLDANNDGWDDLAQANGHVDDFRPESPYAMPAQLLLGGPSGRLVDAGGRAGEPWTVDRLGRAMAEGDLDNDGRMDLVLLSLDAPMALLRNRSGGIGRWATFALEGTGSGRDAVGARVTVSAGGRERVGWRVGGGSYQSSGDPRVHFGLGDADRVDSVEVRWPSGRVDRFGGLPVDSGFLIREGEPVPRPLPGFGAGGRASMGGRETADPGRIDDD